MGDRNPGSLPWSQWHPAKNQNLTPHDVTDGSNKRVWWLCELGHEWQSSVYNRVSTSSKCPFCIGHRVWPGFNDLAATFPEIASQWHPTKNKPLEPSEVNKGSEKKHWWLCGLGHEWEASPANRTRLGSGCAVCNGKVAWPGFNDLESQHPEIAKEWSVKNESSARQTVAGSGKLGLWECASGHEWMQKPVVRTRMGSGCPVCSNQKIVAGVNDLAFFEPLIAEQWHPEKNGELLPSEVSRGSEKKAWWLCPEGHEWQSTISSRRRMGCPVCGNRRVDKGVNDLLTTNPEIASEWHPTRNGDLLPTQVALGQTRAVWWVCEESHEWRATLETRRASGCPKCAKYGFSQHGPSEIYFIENTSLQAWKIGITGTDRKYDRLSSFERLGWRIIHTVEGDGGDVMKVERKVLSWIREELHLPQFLDQSAFGKHGGATETFSLKEELREEIIRRIQMEMSLVNNNSDQV